MAYAPGVVIKDTMLTSVRKDQGKTLLHSQAGYLLLTQNTTEVKVEDILNIEGKVAKDTLLEDQTLTPE